MKKNLIASYVSGVLDTQHGESHKRIFKYFVPEFISALLVYSLPFWLDAYFVSQLQSTTTYATLGATNNLIHFIIKLSEAFSVGTVILSGQFNGKGQYEKAGRVLRDAFWVTIVLGVFMASFLYFGAAWIYKWYGVPAGVIKYGVPFLRLRAISVLFTFVALAFIGFLRGIKNARAAMGIFITGIVMFVVFDYLLIFGKLGLPKMGLRGSAAASIIQYSSMLLFSMAYVFLREKNRRYSIHLFTGILSFAFVRRLFTLSWPVLLDKSTMACAYIWLTKMIAPMGTSAIASYSVVKDMERFAFLPAIASAQVITFLVSNDYSMKKFESIKSNIKKIVFISSIMVLFILLLFSLNPTSIISFFDKKGDFTTLAATAFPYLSVLVVFDLLQLILAGALRGASNVRTVMFVRLAVVLLYFVPFSYALSHANIASQAVKFTLIYGAFYIGSGLMSIAYIYRFRGEKWKTM